jgi:hypothetical protein
MAAILFLPFEIRTGHFLTSVERFINKSHLSHRWYTPLWILYCGFDRFKTCYVVGIHHYEFFYFYLYRVLPLAISLKYFFHAKTV